MWEYKRKEKWYRRHIGLWMSHSSPGYISYHFTPVIAFAPCLVRRYGCAWQIYQRPPYLEIWGAQCIQQPALSLSPNDRLTHKIVNFSPINEIVFGLTCHVTSTWLKRMPALIFQTEFGGRVSWLSHVWWFPKAACDSLWRKVWHTWSSMARFFCEGREVRQFN